MNKLSKIAAAVAVLAAFASTNTFAETASDTVDAKAGIQPAMELVCTDVSFGVWRIPARTGAGGSATFYIGGVLTIPGTISANNYGGYKTTTSATVTANDGV